MTEGKLPEEMNTPEVRPWVERLGRQRGRLVRKRIFDIGASLIILLITSPFLLLLALAIKLDSPGPVFYRQVRVGRYGKDFRIFKFRTMVQDADKKGLTTPALPEWAALSASSAWMNSPSSSTSSKGK